MSEAVLVDADDVGAAEAALSAAYSSMRLMSSSDGPRGRTRVFRTTIGPLTLDDAEFTFRLVADMDPSDEVLLTRVRAGTLGGNLPGRPIERCSAGAVLAFGGRRGERICGDIDRAHYDVVSLDRRLLAQVARGVSDEDVEPVDLTSMTPTSPEANRHLFDVLSHLRRDVASSPHAAVQPLVIGPLLRYLAGCVLSAFPHTAPPAAAVETASQRVLERALSFIEDYADTDISLADIAAAARVTPRSLHVTFARQMNCTPLEFLRDVRLHHAHLDLIAADPDTTTVADIAARWGFGAVEPFSVLYRHRYGISPETTFRR
ncbi:helix-turn-helix transcriptional regulator [Mycolicibacterium parafortuitum]|uniref:AraC family transcriptional regulator [Actinosynnema mirum DSM] n=1 Tax=Mycolicibacterium parafortuitum TaxID=39692 RepID=A0A375YEW0_MYCPF|nr:helix-turn-helix transcriptional regulator [Mycolicibacterium parafortuitum]SRX79618.1 AraC family transcriptional regulator [Actinosynnema mirum DSM] [Mycolicibacterium parafortuitum]